MTDIAYFRDLFNRLNIEYTTKKFSELTMLTIEKSPQIAFTFYEDGTSCSIYILW